MFSVSPELFGVFAVVASAACIAGLVYRARRDPFDPRVIFVCVYAYLTVAPCIYSIFVSHEFHPGLKIEYLAASLYSCSTAVLGFGFGASIALMGVRGSALRPFRVDWRSDAYTNVIVRLALLPCALGAMAGYAYYGSRVMGAQSAGGMAKAHYALYADAGDMRSLYFFGAVSTVCLIYLVVTDAYTGRDWRSPTSIGPILLYLLVCFVNGERDALLVIAVWMMLNWQKLGMLQRAGIVVATAAWVGMAPLLRQFGLGLTSQLNSVGGVSSSDWLQQITHLSPNVHIFTNVVYDVPNSEPFWWGRSLLGAVASFVPGDFALKDETPTRWFATVYTHQGTAGYAFSQDAEAYLNFGWFGPPVWFCVWGYLLGTVYRRAISWNAKAVDIFVWWYFLAVSLFAIRADSRALMKMFVCGFVASKLLWIAAESLHRGRNARAARGWTAGKASGSITSGRGDVRALAAKRKGLEG